MSTLNEFIHSGLLEMYILDCVSDEERIYVDQMISEHEVVASEIALISKIIEQRAFEQTIEPDVTIKPFLLAMINYIERLKKGEAPTFPPVLNEASMLADYAAWTEREDLSVPSDLGAFHANIIGYTPEVTTAIVWLRYLAPPEMHTKERERFLILEGTCDITVEHTVHSLKAGDYFEIPLFKMHHVTVTSTAPCKAILQRIAA